VEDVTWELGGGLVGVTGETGAGKSIIVGALKLILGERADRSLIRTGQEQCSVEASFQLDDSKVVALPLNGRSFVTLSQLAPGVALPPERGALARHRRVAEQEGAQLLRGARVPGAPSRSNPRPVGGFVGDRFDAGHQPAVSRRSGCFCLA
jgi:energy-coupling factor transporter ATP-binding protein EcfA2